jgi:hypothetical protein
MSKGLYSCIASHVIYRPPIEFSQIEMESVQHFQQWLIENELDVPDGYDYREMYRFQQSRKTPHLLNSQVRS